MPHFNIDLCDGRKPVSFSLNAEDGVRFMGFMAECQRLREAQPDYTPGVPYVDPMDDDEDDAA